MNITRPRQFAVTGCLILATIGNPFIGADRPCHAGVNAQEVLQEIISRQERFKNRRVVFESRYITEEEDKTIIKKAVQTIYGENIRSEQWDTRGKERKTHSQAILTPTTQMQWNTVSNGKAFLGSIHKPDERGYRYYIDKHAYPSLIFGLAIGDSWFVWELMADHPDKLSATDTVVNGLRRVSLSASLPIGDYAIEIEPEFEYRIVGISFAKQHSKGHFSDQSEPGRQYTEDEKNNFLEFWNGRLAVDEFIKAGSLWYPSKGEYHSNSHQRHRDTPSSVTWELAIHELEILDEPPPKGTFEIEWPPYCMVTDLREGYDQKNPDRFWANKKGELVPTAELESGGEIPTFPMEGWVDGDTVTNREECLNKFVLVYDWGIGGEKCFQGVMFCDALLDEVGKDGELVVLGVNAFDKQEEIADYCEERGADFPQMFGEPAKKAKAMLGTVGSGSTLLYAPGGKLVARDFDDLDSLKKIIQRRGKFR